MFSARFGEALLTASEEELRSFFAALPQRARRRLMTILTEVEAAEVQHFLDSHDLDNNVDLADLQWPSDPEAQLVGQPTPAPSVKSSTAGSEHTPHPFYSHLSQSSCVKRRLGHSSSATYGLHSPITMLQTQTLRALARTP